MKIVSKNTLILLKNGDETAFKKVYFTYYRLIKHISYYYVANNEVADELVSDVFSALWKSKDLIDEDNKNFVYYLSQIAHNICINFVKKNKKKYEEQLTDYIADNIQAEVYKEQNKGSNAEKMQFIAETLDKESYDILILHYVHGYKYKEIAIMKKLELSNVTVIASRAVQKVREKYNEKKNK